MKRFDNSKINYTYVSVIVMALVLAVLFLPKRNASYRAEENASSVTFFAMDTVMSLKIYGDPDGVVAGKCVDEVNRLDALLSTGSEQSEVYKLNASQGGELSDDTRYLLEKSLEISSDTNGVFDISVYPLMRAWGFTNGEYIVPTDEEIRELTKKVNYQELSLSTDKTALFMPEGMEIDFGGIAKGYTAMRLIEILKENGIQSAMLNLGGNVQALGLKPDGEKYKVAIEKPEDNQSYLAVLYVSDKSVVTSGSYERYFEENGTRYHHILDPETGRPADSGLSSVTIVCDDGTTADAYSTALFVMGLDDAISFWKEKQDEFQAVLYTTDGKLYITSGLKGIIETDLNYEIIE